MKLWDWLVYLKQNNKQINENQKVKLNKKIFKLSDIIDKNCFLLDYEIIKFNKVIEIHE